MTHLPGSANAATARSWRRAAQVIPALAALAVILASCLPTNSGTPPPGQLRFLCSNDDAVCAQWAAAFTQETGIATSYQRLPTAEALARLEAHRLRPEFDLWAGGPSENYLIAKQRGLLAPAQLPASHIPARFRDREGYWYGVYASLLALCVNDQVLAQQGLPAPTGWQDLEARQWDSWISASSPLTSGTAFTALWTQATIYGAQAPSHLQAVYRNVGRLTQSGTAPANVVARGEAGVAITFAPYCEAAAASYAVPLRVVYPQEGTFYEVGGAAVLNRADHAPQAQQFLQWLTSAPGQLASSQVGIKQIPVNESVPGNLNDYLISTHIKVLDISVEQASQAHAAWLEWFARTQW